MAAVAAAHGSSVNGAFSLVIMTDTRGDRVQHPLYSTSRNDYLGSERRGHPIMADPENQTLRLLRELREQSSQLRADMIEQNNALRTEMREGFEHVNERLRNLQQAMIGESVLGRYTVAEVEERLDNLEQRVSALEEKR
jgi:polyhydroxyalkanoate synthesis regulator phasin